MRLCVGCVADDTPKYLDQALRLLQSWRWFAGPLADAEFYVCVVERIADADRAAFAALGAQVRVVARYSAAHPPSNKLRFFTLPELAGADRVVLLDCDTLVVQPPLALLAQRELAAKIADFATVPAPVLARLFAAFGVPLPAPSERCTVSGEAVIPYFNAGVLSLSPRALQTLVPAWLRFNAALVAQLDLLDPARNFCEQASLSLAVAATGTGFDALDNALNFPAHCREQAPDSAFAATDPVIVHYHDLIDRNGLLQPSPYPQVDRRLRAFNARLAAAWRGHFDNRRFWDRRYRLDPALGSGAGSRGAVASYKRGLIERAVAELHPASVLDVGCGDLAVGAAVPAAGYLGVDVAPAVLEANAVRWPERAFRCGDLLDLDLAPRELVLCLDVLIHVAERDRYRALVERCVALATRAGIVAAYDQAPAHGSEITFFHEPIAATLAAAGATDLRLIGAYHQVRVYRFDKGPRPRAAVAAPLRRPVFLVGAMRSGTTLLADALGRSPALAHCPFELKDLWSQAGVPMASPKTRDRDCPECGAGAASAALAERLGAALAARRAMLADKTADAALLNKNPHLCNKLGLVHALFADARFLWIYRRLPQTVASLRRLFADVCKRQSTWHHWPAPAPGVRNRCWHAVHTEAERAALAPERTFPGGDIRYLAEYWFESNRAVAEFFAANPGVGAALSYEALVAAPAEVLARLQGYLETPLAAAVAIADLDAERNREWQHLLSGAEARVLADFVAAHAEAIGGLFAGEAPAAAYLRDLRGAQDPAAAPARRQGEADG